MIFEDKVCRCEIVQLFFVFQQTVHFGTYRSMQYVFVMGGWDGMACSSEIAVFSPDGAPSSHMAPKARNMLSPRDALSSVVVGHDVIALGILKFGLFPWLPLSNTGEMLTLAHCRRA